ncbi:MAG: DUF1838 family protein [Gammaproteobacteria bacterium]|nr:DUF1838 family protein [Gammaproteobacteria bacterium]
MTYSGSDFNLETREGRLLSYVKLRASLEGHSSAWWYRGIQYGVVDLVPQRLWGVQGVQVFNFARRDDGTFENRFRDLMFYQDLATGKQLEQFLNPYTGETIEPPVLRVGPMFLLYSSAGASIKDAENIPPGLETSWSVDPAIVNGDDVILHEEGHSKVEQGPMRVVLNDFITFQGSLADLQNPALMNAPGRYSYCSVMTWSPFMKMDGQPGHLMGRGNGRKLRSRQELEPGFAELVLEAEPGWLDDVSFPND